MNDNKYQNGKIKLPMSESSSGTFTPNIKKFTDEMIAVFDESDQDGAHDVVVDTLIDYLVKSNRTKLMEK